MPGCFGNLLPGVGFGGCQNLWVGVVEAEQVKVAVLGAVAGVVYGVPDQAMLADGFPG